MRAGSATNAADTIERTKYRFITSCYQFEAVAIETAGTCSEGTKNIVHGFGRRLTEATGDQLETFWSMQRLSLALHVGLLLLRKMGRWVKYFLDQNTFRVSVDFGADP